MSAKRGERDRFTGAPFHLKDVRNAPVVSSRLLAALSSYSRAGSTPAASRASRCRSTACEPSAFEMRM